MLLPRCSYISPCLNKHGGTACLMMVSAPKTHHLVRSDVFAVILRISPVCRIQPSYLILPSVPARPAASRAPLRAKDASCGNTTPATGNAVPVAAKGLSPTREKFVLRF